LANWFHFFLSSELVFFLFPDKGLLSLSSTMSLTRISLSVLVSFLSLLASLILINHSLRCSSMRASQVSKWQWLCPVACLADLLLLFLDLLKELGLNFAFEKEWLGFLAGVGSYRQILGHRGELRVVSWVSHSFLLVEEHEVVEDLGGSLEAFKDCEHLFANFWMNLLAVSALTGWLALIQRVVKMDKLIVGNILNEIELDFEGASPFGWLSPEFRMTSLMIHPRDHLCHSLKVLWFVDAIEKIEVTVLPRILLSCIEHLEIGFVKNHVSSSSRTPNAVLDCLVDILFSIWLYHEEAVKRVSRLRQGARGHAHQGKVCWGSNAHLWKSLLHLDLFHVLSIDLRDGLRWYLAHHVALIKSRVD